MGAGAPAETARADSTRRYVAATLRQPAMPSFEDKVNAVRKILRGLEGGTSGIRDEVRWDASDDEEDRKLLATLLVSYDGSNQVCILEDKETEDGETQPPEQKQRTEERDHLRRLSPQQGEPNEGMSFVGNFDMNAVVRWRKYRKGFAKILHDMKNFLKLSCSKAIPWILFSHAKRVEVSDDEFACDYMVASSNHLRKSYDEILHMHDALATCQRRVHDAMMGLEDALEVYIKEATFVNQQEDQLLHNFESFEMEYNALKELRYRLNGICGLVPR
ncbi:unnamed protein product [Phytomonas sp. Hart1]|nr:unnamed protein product [Phytomonas sp. Hart1]|eukprot:CCW71027.1 unnamed protein product [Phytomonas sp. isolate Hart1]